MISEILDKYLLENKRPAIEHKDRFYPTSSSTYINFGKYKKLEGKCMRAAYFSCLGEPEFDDESFDRSLVMLLGEYTELMILDICKKENILIDKEVKFNIEDYHIYGKLDGIIEIDKKKYGLEIKSIGGNSKYTVNSIFGSDFGEGKPKWQNLFQTLIYCYAFQEELPNGFILLYIRRDTCERKEFHINIQPYNGKIYPVIDGKMDMRYNLSDILDRYKLLYKYIKENKIPPKEYMDIYPKNMIETYYKLGIISKRQFEKYDKEPFGDFSCAYCSYKYLCDKEGDSING